jgi:cytochrome oxidase assembly protein ShyY1
MLSLLRTRRWLSFTASVLLVIIAFGFRSRWQRERAAEKKSLNTSIVAARAADPISPANVQEEWTPVKVSGAYDPDHEVVVRKRPQDTVNGFWIMTPLVTDSGTVWVNRGWLRATDNAMTYPDVPPAPTGDVTVTGLWRHWESARTTTGLPAGMISDVDPAVLSTATDFQGYVQLTGSSPKQAGLDSILLPEIDDSRNVSYAVQWILFALVCIGGWFFFLRREARDDAQRDNQEA